LHSSSSFYSPSQFINHITNASSLMRKSIKSLGEMISVCILWSRVHARSYNSDISWVSQDLYLWKPCCNLNKISFPSKWSWHIMLIRRYNVFKEFASNRGKWYWMIVPSYLWVAFFKNIWYIRSFPVSGNVTRVQRYLE